MTEKVYVGDTAIIEAWCFEEDGETPANCTEVSWSYLVPGDPAGTDPILTAPTTGVTPTEGATLSGMTGTYEYLMTQMDGVTESLPTTVQSIIVTDKRVTVSYGAADVGVTVRRIYRRKSPNTEFRLLTTIGSGSGSYSDTTIEDPETGITPVFVSGTNVARLIIDDTNTVGFYRAVCTFTKEDGTKKSIIRAFTVEDPLELPASDDLGKTLELAWIFLEDCFDSEMGGPWLRDVTLKYFNKEKLANFAGSALFIINQKPPVSGYDETSFPYVDAMPLFAKGVLIQAIKHLIRSYAEQPNVVGAGQISYFDRREYYRVWKEILEQEQEEFATWLALYKRGQYEFGSSKVLVDIKGGRRLLLWPGYRLRWPRYPYW